jgi:hypothetical protein
MILAEGFDGHVATQSFTLPVLPVITPQRPVNYAEIDRILYRNSRMRAATSSTTASAM